MRVERAPLPAIEAHAVSKRFILHHNRSASLKVRFLGLLHEGHREVLEDFWALRDVSLSIRRGESVGVVGRNGSGKSTLLKLIAGIHRPTTGRLLISSDARIGTMIELGVGFHPDLSGTENVFLNAAIHGLNHDNIAAIYPSIVEYSGLGHFMDVALKNYSSGMQMRLGFAIAANLNPDILLLDEIFAVGDTDFQKQCMKTMDRFADEGRTLVFVSHVTASVQALCRRVCVLDRGRLMFDGPVEAGLAEYQRLLTVDAAAPLGEAPGPGRDPKSLGDAAMAAAEPPAHPGGEWQLDFLTREGLAPHHRVLEIGCGPAGISSAVAGYVGAERYEYWQYASAHIAGARPFDYAMASPLFSRLALNAIARVIATVVRVLAPGGRFYATWFDAPGPAAFEPVLQRNGVTTFPEAEPYHYPFEVLAGLCSALGAHAGRVTDATHPGGESVLVLVKA